ncbi:hypothetical protein KL918_002558 [Ogataea parapolymorpha]|uniref:ATP-dependent RNA helicase DRS1 n=1 Tax=Ogataea parapolymorpha (strain ATCC 26012 / BCRC 20466 / JCM 22074 / NRRL Y-7560 / DL-1) TaxID=871575 RepID=W1QIZ0_OGAPD|nr:ATP-dependent RNA helicase DRS1 [Ogataea parapolymorpha DL-1]ESX02673.1 ATP-dependent RNA helicase DRS1 [Ogataea parapolymorpha DL-1]KAG7867961.1 hypothetical protein KL918_002558 [Ogataea parapolymorpha]KAG7870461.1 hypothetical protein KL916_004937 [Ogataea parapolymorpha]
MRSQANERFSMNHRKPPLDIDQISTISDNDEEVPDLDESGDEDSPDNNEKSNLKTTRSRKSTRHQKNDFDDSFVFALHNNGQEDKSFDGWNFELEGKQSSMNKDVDLDNIIKRKGGLSGNILELEKHNYLEQQEVQEENQSSDEELALDGFGMGAPDKVVTEPSDADSDDDTDTPAKVDNKSDAIDRPEEKSDTHSQSHASSKNNLDGTEIVSEDADSPDAIASYFASDENSKSHQSEHQSFQSLKLSRPILKALSALGYSKPSAIQSASIPIALLGKDIVAGAVTGSGKTAAYMIPIIERLLYKPSKMPSTRVIVLAPTRELAIQVADVGKKIGQFVNGLTFGLAVGGLNLRQQEQELKKRPDIVIATPGRLIDHIRNSVSFNVESVEVLVFDEADRMLEEGFQKELTEILSLLPLNRQTMLFSATMNSRIKSLIQLSLKKPVRVMIGAPKAAASELVQEFVRIRKRESSKPALLFNILSEMDGLHSRVIVFVSRKEMAHRLRISLGLLGLKVSELHGSLTQEQRLKAIVDFKNLTVPILICTDLAARGLDIPKIELVINFDMPKTYEIYLHRVGRTARAGRKGLSISFVGESSQDRNIVKEAIKQVETENAGKAIGRNVNWENVEKIHRILQEKESVIFDVLNEEKQEKELLKAEQEIKKGENMLNFEQEIKSRPKRTWFMTSQQKKKESDRLNPENQKDKKLNSKKRKALEAQEISERLYKKTKNDRLHSKSLSRRPKSKSGKR